MMIQRTPALTGSGITIEASITEQMEGISLVKTANLSNPLPQFKYPLSPVSLHAVVHTLQEQPASKTIPCYSKAQGLTAILLKILLELKHFY